MKIKYAQNLTLLSEILNSFEKDNSVKTILIFTPNDITSTKLELERLLKKIKKPIIGGIFPSIAFQNEIKDEGFLIKPLLFEMDIQIIDLDKPIEKQLDSFFETINPSKINTIYTFVDAFGNNKSEYIYQLYNYLGNTVQYIGACAGNLSLSSIPCIIHNSGIHQNTAIIGLSNQNIEMGYSHGCKPISEPIKVTETKKNRIISLNWNPAFKEYQNILKQLVSIDVEEENFDKIKLNYSFGLAKLDSEMIIREPYSQKNNEIYLFDEVNEGEYLYLMECTEENLHQAVVNASNYASINFHKNDLEDTDELFSVFCYARFKDYKKDLTNELNSISKINKMNVNGIITLGEIANSGECFLEIYNKAIVLLSWKMKI